MPMSRTVPYAQVDVFSPQPYGGNPLAVILDGSGLSDEAMQSIARWTNLSETTFVSSPQDAKADYGLRIFTPGGEVPFAGHPTLGSAHAWLEHGGMPHTPGTLIQECPAGLVTLRQHAGKLSFAAPKMIRTGAIEHDYLESLTADLGIPADRVVSHQWVDNGPGWAVIRVSSAQEVLELHPNFARAPKAMVGVIGAYPKGSPCAFELRTFAPGVGVSEDPVCGSMNASVAQWLIGSGEMTGPYVVSQGTCLHRAGRIEITPGDDGTVWVGGHTATMFSGSAVI
jgi:PhzF family phenazine biosynthesis protein